MMMGVPAIPLLRKTARWCVVAALATAMAASPAFAGGFLLQQTGARGTGMGDVGLASVGEPLVLQNNPASMGFLRGTALSLGTTVVVPDTRFHGDDQSVVKMSSQVLFPPEVSLTHSFASGWSIGASASTPFAFRTEWNDRWVGAREAVGADLRVVIASLGVAYKLSHTLSAGAAVNIGFPRMQYSRRMPVSPDAAGDLLESLDGSGPANAGISVGLFYHPWERLSVGLSYMSRMSMHLDDARMTYDGVPDSLSGLFVPTDVSARFSTPDVFSAGLSLGLLPGVSIEVNGHYTSWSVMKTVTLTYGNAALEASTLARKSIPYYWHDSWTVNGGLQIDLGDLVLRGGMTFDQTPVRSEDLRATLPDADRRGISGGIGYWVSDGLRLDFAYEYVRFDDRLASDPTPGTPTVLPPGHYTTNWNVIGFTVNYFWN